MLVIEKGIPLFSRTLPVGAQGLLADRDKWEGRLVQELGRAIETFRTEMASARIESITVSGAASGLPWIVPRLEEEFRVPVAVSDVSGLLNPDALGRFTDDPRVKGLSLTGLIGAALGVRDLQINLTPPSVKVRESITAKARELSVFAALMMTILSLGTLWVESRLSARQAYLDTLDDFVEKTTRTAENVRSMQAKVALVAERMEGAMLPDSVLADLTARLGDDVSLTSLVMERKTRQVTCRGIADSVPRLVMALQASPLFQNVKTKRSDKTKDAVEFELTFDVRKKQP